MRWAEQQTGHAIQRDPTAHRAGYAIQDAINQHLHGTMGRPRDPTRSNAPGRLRVPAHDQPQRAMPLLRDPTRSTGI
jgi:hypothetical protein